MPALASFFTVMLIVLSVEMHAQSTSNPSLPQYGTVAVHLAPENPPFLGCETQPARLRCFSNVRALISEAYSIRYEFILQGPKWVDDKVWALQATLDSTDSDRVKDLARDQRNAMLQGILADRFALKIHPEIRIQPVYDLVVAHGGHKLQPSAPASDADVKDLPAGFARTDFFTISGETARGFGETMNEIIKQLPGALGSGQIDRPILDKSGLAGRWNFTLRLSPESAEALSPFTRLEEQLGLKLLPAKEPVPVLVVDEVHLPTAN